MTVKDAFETERDIRGFDVIKKEYYGTQLSDKIKNTPAHIMEKRKNFLALFRHFRDSPLRPRQDAPKEFHDLFITLTINT